jgi:hypothetical protein
MLSAKPLNGNQVRKIALDSVDADEFAELIDQKFEKEFKNHIFPRK